MCPKALYTTKIVPHRALLSQNCAPQSPLTPKIVPQGPLCHHNCAPQSPLTPKLCPKTLFSPTNVPQRGILLHRGRGSTAHAQTSPCYSIGAFIKCAPRPFIPPKLCPTEPSDPKIVPQGPLCHQNCAPQSPLTPKLCPKTLFSPTNVPQRGILLHRGRGSTAHAQTPPCYSIGAFIKCALQLKPVKSS